MAIEIVDFPMNSMVIFQFVMWKFTRGYLELENSIIDLGFRFQLHSSNSNCSKTDLALWQSNMAGWEIPDQYMEVSFAGKIIEPQPGVCLKMGSTAK